MPAVGESYRARNRSWLRGVILVAALVACSGKEKQHSEHDTPVASADQVSGQQTFQLCATCHQPNGQGLPGAYPPLAGGEYANASNPAVPILIVMNGIQGPVTVKGQQFNGVMPAYGTGVELSDETVAAVLTYVRSSWGNSASAITEEDVEKVRKTPREATGPVTAAELNAMMSARK